MKGILYARVLRVRKDWKSLVFWMLFPLLLTFLTSKIVGFWGEDSKIPIGIVVEEESLLSNGLIEKLEEVSYIDVKLLNEREAINQLEKHELDSVFVLHNRYEEMILDGKRNQLIDAYSSNRSYAYFAVKELMTSFVQEDVSRMRAAYEVKDLFKEYGSDEEWNWEEIVQVSVEKQETQQLLQTNFSYQNQTIEIEEDEVLPVFNIWGIWAFFSLISTFFIFDWVIKEKRDELHIRWLFTSISFKYYAIISFALYTVIIVLVDLLSLFILNQVLMQPNSSAFWISFLFYKFVISLLAFLVVNVFKQSLMYYVSTFGFALILTLLSGAIIPIDGLTTQWSWIKYLSPITSLIAEQIPFVWLVILLGWFCIWYMKGDKLHA
ncbi:ABC transporter permease [Ureibacillus acetophenoni]|uniref:ABC-2 type transport system permease protein n=1 Tax=Ureibacillus acetophenoni TaxID=614649 RepID=A0A285UFC1_9BACL|nr:ABC transporter permease [Ureibacillus acetophenoni]SOC39276.1 ABC-2 type transport system permease protein [Ureibacillus acetophenoni]